MAFVLVPLLPTLHQEVPSLQATLLSPLICLLPIQWHLPSTHHSRVNYCHIVQDVRLCLCIIVHTHTYIVHIARPIFMFV